MTDEVLTFDMVDDLRAELEAARVEASDLAGKLLDCERERDEARAKLDAQTQSYREARAMWPEGYTHAAWGDLLRVEWKRATTYRNRALALMQQSQAWRKIAKNHLASLREMRKSRESALSAEAQLAAARALLERAKQYIQHVDTLENSSCFYGCTCGAYQLLLDIDAALPAPTAALTRVAQGGDWPGCRLHLSPLIYQCRQKKDQNHPPRKCIAHYSFR